MSFLNPVFFLGAIALSIPILVHLVRREQAERVLFPSLMFLQRIPQRIHKRRQLQHLLLFLLRSAAVTLLFLAFARPFFSGADVERGEATTTAIILLDTSLSMKYADRFPTALARAREIVQRASGKEKIGLVTFSTATDVLSEPTSDRWTLEAALARARPSFRGTNYLTALRTAAQLLGNSASRDKVIYLVSDFQASGLPRQNEPFSLPASVRLVPVDVATDEGENLAVGEMASEPFSSAARYEGKLVARLDNYGPRSRTVTVSLVVNDRRVDQKKVDVAARASRSVEFTGFFLGSGPNRVSVDCDRDRLSDDDRFYATVWRRDPTRVLILQQAERGSRRGSFYFEQALLAGEGSSFTVMSREPDTLTVEEIRRAGLVVLHRVRRLGPTVVPALKAFVQDGGGIIVSLGEEATQPEVRSLLMELGALSVTGIERPQASSYRILSEIETTHPIFRIFQSGRSANFSLARIYGFVKLAPSDRASVLARLDDGSPAVIEIPQGKGKVIVLAFPLDATWSTLPLTPVYVPFVRQMVGELKPEARRPFYRVGDRIALVGASELTPLAVESPSGERVSKKTGLAEDFRSFVAEENGFYTIGHPGSLDYVAVNVDSTESNLTKADLAEVVKRFTGRETEAMPLPTSGSGETQREWAERQKVWWTLLVVALLLLVSEAVVATRRPRRRAAAP